MTVNPQAANPEAVGRFDLTGKVAWVIGGAGLLGTEVSRALAEHGAQVIVSDFRADQGESLAATLRDAGLKADAVSADIGDESQIIALTRDLAAKYGKLDIMVNMTYYYTKKPWLELAAADFDACMRVSLTGAFVATREVGKQMVEQGGGSIVHFSSMYGQPDRLRRGEGRHPADGPLPGRATRPQRRPRQRDRARPVPDSLDARPRQRIHEAAPQ
jgi:NAD(P)-dependent dehydrogenase (short-subunit alcohol dehydrogenase family)